MPNHEDIPRNPGSYILFLLLSRSETIPIGSLGTWELIEGYYAYTGSAQGPGGLKGRIERHLRPHHEKRTHWHIDRVTARSIIAQVWWEEGNFQRECTWAQQLSSEGSIAVPKFGSSDCGCPGHLIWLPTLGKNSYEWDTLQEKLGAEVQATLISRP
jgi:Uri superfamily endonuclease